MGTKRLTEIIIETERTLVVGSGGQPTKEFCSGCVAEVEMLTPEQAAAIVKIPPRTVYRWIEAGLLHFIEDAEGIVLICRNSLYGRNGRE
jgi:excisionase family DNA binding protein